jgi:ubiquinone/menaquinone biosynthesis C-methylase UbiE
MEKLVEFFSQKPIRRVLDIGTGAGDFIQLIKSAFPESVAITGVDPSEDALTEARKLNTSDQITFKQMEGERLEFADHSFDVVSMSNAMHHLANPEKTLSEMKRVVKPGGWLIIAEIVSDGLNEAQENQKMLHHFKSFIDQKSGITHRETWTEAEVLEIIQFNGIRPVLTFPFNRMPQPVTDPEKLETWVQTFAGHLAHLEGLPEYVDKAALFGLFKTRLNRYGFQVARQVVAVGQVNE